MLITDKRVEINSEVPHLYQLDPRSAHVIDDLRRGWQGPMFDDAAYAALCAHLCLSCFPTVYGAPHDDGFKRMAHFLYCIATGQTADRWQEQLAGLARDLAAIRSRASRADCRLDGLGFGRGRVN